MTRGPPFDGMHQLCMYGVTHTSWSQPTHVEWECWLCVWRMRPHVDVHAIYALRCCTQLGLNDYIARCHCYIYVKFTHVFDCVAPFVAHHVFNTFMLLLLWCCRGNMLFVLRHVHPLIVSLPPIDCVDNTLLPIHFWHHPMCCLCRHHIYVITPCMWPPHFWHHPIFWLCWHMALVTTPFMSPHLCSHPIVVTTPCVHDMCCGECHPWQHPQSIVLTISGVVLCNA